MLPALATLSTGGGSTDLGVKASGGIRTAAEAVAMLRAGADRIGASSAASWKALIGPNGPTVAEALA